MWNAKLRKTQKIARFLALSASVRDVEVAGSNPVAPTWFYDVSGTIPFMIAEKRADSAASSTVFFVIRKCLNVC
jgi:hypothetical protein